MERKDNAAIALALFESDAQGIAIVDQRGLIVKTNPRLAQIFGYGPKELVGQSIEMWFRNVSRRSRFPSR